ncbi:MAG: prepilin-type N-terminal cleavage/methylation domain-containing protein [Actinobacteria bacterium]|nr:prepilin-type N-terminal cleavage/methylation domain-containing protein [Actinomycetota bacterium]MCG2802361.1 prepilin-type N-terminal cleavage/methylation domain-containing protein [Cellulomonas sp.]
MSARIRKSMEQRDGGFTLVELLVVMIIIGILAAIAIPVFLNQQKKARETSAKADVSTIGKEIAAYYVDGTGPLSVTTAGNKWTLYSGTNAITDGTLSTGNTATGAVAKILSNTTYCVEVAPTNATTWHYSQSGLASGVCP